MPNNATTLTMPDPHAPTVLPDVAADFMAAMGRPLLPSAGPPLIETAPATDAVEPVKPARRRRVAPPVPPRPVPPHVVLHDDRPVMSVALVGELGAGKRFLVDLLTYDRMKLFGVQEWTLTQPGGAGTTAYVASRRKQAQKIMGEDHTAGSSIRLARWITRAPPGSVVTYLDKSPLNLTNRNLAVVDRGEFWDELRGRSANANDR